MLAESVAGGDPEAVIPAREEWAEQFLSHEESHPTAHILRFHATFKRGWLRGCLRNSEYLRPGNRQVWDGTGRVTSTSASLRTYRGLKLTDGGSTPAGDLTVAKPFRFDADPSGGGC